MSGDQFVGTNSRQLVIRTDLNSTMWGLFASTLISDRNLFWNPTTANVFQRDGGRTMDLAGWRINTTEDANSVFKDPKFADPDHGNFTPTA
jgi:hypothetical protein